MSDQIQEQSPQAQSSDQTQQPVELSPRDQALEALKELSPQEAPSDPEALPQEPPKDNPPTEVELPKLDKLDALVREENKIRKQRLAFEQERNSFNETLALKDKDPVAFFEKIGVDPGALGRSILGVEESVDPTQKVSSEVEQLRKELQEQKELYQSQMRAAFLKSETLAAESFLKGSEKHPILRHMVTNDGLRDHIIEQILNARGEGYRSTGKLPGFDNLADSIENELSSMYQLLHAAITGGQKAPSEKQAPKAAPVRDEPKTLARQSLGATSGSDLAESDDDRKAQAVAILKAAKLE